LEILLTYLNPFIDYPFNISEDWYINLELKYIIIKLVKEKQIFNSEAKNNLIKSTVIKLKTVNKNLVIIMSFYKV
jgi:hypothetical protein